MLELYICKDCGKPTNNKHVISLMNGEDIIIHRCDNCKEKLSAEIDWQNEQFREDDIICPWCGDHFSDYEDMSQVVDNPYEESERKVKCPCCEKEFELEIETVCYYTTRKPSEQFNYEAYLQENSYENENIRYN